MPKKIIFQDSVLISSVMCYEECGLTVHSALCDLTDYKKKQLIPQDAMISVDVEPQSMGVNCYVITIESADDGAFQYPANWYQSVSQGLKTSVEDVGHELIKDPKAGGEQDTTASINWINILINILVITGIITLSVVFPPSIPLTIILASLCFLTTLFTARKYFFDFFRLVRLRQLSTMPTAITSAWLLSLAHTIYHATSMGSMFHFSMMFMNFVMPVMLVTIVNCMDELKRWVLKKSQVIYLRGMKSLLPTMQEVYDCYQLAQDEIDQLKILIEGQDTPKLDGENQHGDGEAISDQINRDGDLDPDLDLGHMPVITLTNDSLVPCSRHVLKKGMVVRIKQGECFPIDGYIILGETMIDARILNGKHQQVKHSGQFVPAGAVNLGREVVIYATKNIYDSAVNKIMLVSNRTRNEQQKLLRHSYFTYLYSGLIVIALIAALVTPLALGMFSVPLLLQSITCILFVICPCTIAIAHELPNLLSRYRLQEKHQIILQHDGLLERFDDIQTIVFDKTGTLTTGLSEVGASSKGISSALWQRIYLLENQYGFDHPLAKAICRYCEQHRHHQTKFTEIQGLQDHLERPVPIRDKKNRGLSAQVQGVQIHIGSERYMIEWGIHLPEKTVFLNRYLNAGYSPVYVAERGKYQGVILIRHQIRPDIIPSLQRLKNSGKKLIMLTGDGSASAFGFNKHLGNVFDLENIHTEQTAGEKEKFLNTLLNGYELELMSSLPNQDIKQAIFGKVYLSENPRKYFVKGMPHQEGISAEIDLVNLENKCHDPHFKKTILNFTSQKGHTLKQEKSAKKVWFIGDGLNDAPSARLISEQGGVSCAITETDKAAFFTDISLNGSLSYLFSQKKLNEFSKNIVSQNQWLLAYGVLVFLAFVICMPIMGIGFSPIIPVVVMVLTTLFTLFNSYRVNHAVDDAFVKHPSWIRSFLASDLSLGCIVAASALFVVSIMVFSISVGHLSLPAFIFTAGVSSAVSSGLLIAGITMAGALILLMVLHASSRFLNQNSLAACAVDPDSGQSLNSFCDVPPRDRKHQANTHGDGFYKKIPVSGTGFSWGIFSPVVSTNSDLLGSEGVLSPNDMKHKKMDHRTSLAPFAHEVKFN